MPCTRSTSMSIKLLDDNEPCTGQQVERSALRGGQPVSGDLGPVSGPREDGEDEEDGEVGENREISTSETGYKSRLVKSE